MLFHCIGWAMSHSKIQRETWSGVDRVVLIKHETMDGWSVTQFWSDYKNSIRNLKKKTHKFSDLCSATGLYEGQMNEWYNITKDKIVQVMYNDSSIVVIWCLEQITFSVLFKLCMPTVKWRLMVIQCLVGLWSFFLVFPVHDFFSTVF